MVSGGEDEEGEVTVVVDEDAAVEGPADVADVEEEAERGEWDELVAEGAAKEALHLEYG